MRDRNAKIESTDETAVRDETDGVGAAGEPTAARRDVRSAPTGRTTTDEVPSARTSVQPGRRVESESDTSEDAGFLPQDRMDQLRGQWSEVQVSFVDDPQSAVEQAHQMVTQVVSDLTEIFSRERSSLEAQWSAGGDADTESLRVALQRYRSFFNRLLSATSAP